MPGRVDRERLRLLPAWMRPDGQRVSIRNPDGAELASAGLTAFDGEAHVMSAFGLAGASRNGRSISTGPSSPLRRRTGLRTKRHDRVLLRNEGSRHSVNVWGLPSA